METTLKLVTGINKKEVSLIAPLDLVFPTQYVPYFDTYCGAGDGFGDSIVPDTIWGVPVSPACFIHDYMWEHADPTWAEFHQSNSIFLRNLNELIRVQSKNKLMKNLRMYRSVTFYNAVDTFGSKIFWNLKKQQENLKEL